MLKKCEQKTKVYVTIKYESDKTKLSYYIRNIFLIILLMYSTKKIDNIQVNLTGSGVFNEKSTNFPWDYFNRLWSLLFFTANGITIFHNFYMANITVDCWNCFFRSRVYWQKIMRRFFLGYYSWIWTSFSSRWPDMPFGQVTRLVCYINYCHWFFLRLSKDTFRFISSISFSYFIHYSVIL